MRGIHKCMQCHSLTSTKSPFYKLSKKPLWQSDTREELSILLLNWQPAHAAFRWRPMMNSASFFFSLHHLVSSFLSALQVDIGLYWCWISELRKRPSFWFIDKIPARVFTASLLLKNTTMIATETMTSPRVLSIKHLRIKTGTTTTTKSVLSKITNSMVILFVKRNKALS